jgi:hypothetical protein
MKRPLFYLFAFAFLLYNPPQAESWFDETHIAVAKAAGYSKLFNAA